MVRYGHGEQSVRLQLEALTNCKYTPSFQQCVLDLLKTFQRAGDGKLRAVVEQYKLRRQGNILNWIVAPSQLDPRDAQQRT